MSTYKFNIRFYSAILLSLVLSACGGVSSDESGQTNNPDPGGGGNGGGGGSNQFNFSVSSFSVNEGSSVTILVTRTSTSDQASVFYETVGQGAISGQDYNGFAPTELIFTVGQSSNYFTVTTIDDNVAEGNEALSLELSSPSSGYSLGNISATTLTIIDNDSGGGGGGGGGGTSNNAPTISGNPTTTITEGNAYNFTANGNDIDGDALSYSINGIPSWASFNTTSGTLSGTPGSSDVGVYSNIVISVSDGLATDALPSFSITVNSSNATGTATVSWTSPTTNVDDTELTDLAGFKIYFGTDPGNLASSVDINNPSLTAYMLETLNTNVTYYFGMTAYDTSGNESPISNVMSLLVQ